MTEEFIERRIVIGLIISTEYVHQVRSIWNATLLESPEAKRIAGWCIEFYDQYKTAPGQEIESIFLKRTKTVPKAEAQDIQDILGDLSDEYEREEKFNVQYLVDQTVQYIDERNLKEFIEGIEDVLATGDIIEAKRLAQEYRSVVKNKDRNLDFSDPEIINVVERAFEKTNQPVVTYPRQLGQFWNDEMVRGGFVALMAPEKRGKTFMLLDIAMRAARQGSNVAFFQAGDMTEDQQVRRMCIYLTKKSDKEKYSGKMYQPIRDCVYNQMDDCDRKEREVDFGSFEGREREFLRRDVKLEDLIEAYKDEPKYKACYNCKDYWKKQYGAVWLKEVDTGSPLTTAQAKRAVEKFFVQNKRRFKMSSHPNKTLTVSKMESVLDLWEREDNFVADLIITDYVDIHDDEIRAEFRHQENDKWMRLRGLSEKRHALVITVTQTDASSYEKDRLTLKNFSEDKRKFAHVTAMYGLNQDRKGREKEIGIMRINQIVVREDAFLSSNEVYVLQNLKRGQPCLESFW